ncbi:MAG: hypothetical protein Q9170_000168 [Blastenia crenularia]
MARMLDVQFRHLRYDIFEPVIDACYHASQQLRIAFKHPAPIDYEVRHCTVRGTQYSLFRDVRLENLRFEEEGIHLRLSFACPVQLRQRRIHTSGHFENGMLMALVGLDTEHTLSTTFCKIETRQSTSSMEPITGNHLRASVVTSFADPADTDTVRQALYGLKQISRKEKFILVEFPTVLVAGYHWILKHLKYLDSTKTATSFSDIIAPSSTQAKLPIPPPTYPATDSSGFDLSVLRAPSYRDGSFAPKVGPDFLRAGSTEQKALVEDICSVTTLDQGQATALCENLSRGLAFTQGPPGTGKTFLGVSLAKIILQRMPEKPIIVACMTNHALDNFLADLLAQGISKVARLGSGSKEDWTSKYTLKSLRKNFKNSCAESTKITKAYHRFRSLSEEGTRCCESLNSHIPTWATMRDHLKHNYWNVFHNFVTCLSRQEQQIEDIRKKRSAAGGSAFEYWCNGGDFAEWKEVWRDMKAWFGKTTADSDSPDNSSESETSSTEPTTSQPEAPVDHPYGEFKGDAWALSMDMRAAWISRWKSELGTSIGADRLAEIQRRYIAAKESKREIHNAVDARCLADQEVIGMTTTGCAKYWSILKSLDLQTLICEEAGEIMEAQTISTLLPSIGHAMFIGDPLQLRPQINQPCLSLETTYGRRYRLDESLFERMVLPQTQSTQSLPASKLKLQRRMHPDVADLMRATLYPYLEDHPSTSRLPVAGMVHRTFWLDHKEREDNPDPLAVGGRSYSNGFECAMICELVRYLINTNDFGSGDITILVPYNRQLSCLKDRLTRTRTCSIILSDQDKERLIDIGLLDENEQQQIKSDVEILPMVRLATIDSFQGEEAKVIILSTVRSNLQDRVGFLQTTNRINVACSRARNGFYIVGNSTLLRTVDMWESIIANFQVKGRIGPSFLTHCSRHPHLVQAVSQPQQFQKSPLHAAHSATLCMSAVTNAVGNASNVKRIGSTANVWVFVVNIWHAAIPAQNRATTMADHVLHANIHAYELVSMARYVGNLATLFVTHAYKAASRHPAPIEAALRFVHYLVTDYLAQSHCETGEVPVETKIFLPCGHDINVADLDSKLNIGEFFELSVSGGILALKPSMAETCTKSLQCPQCGAPCDDTLRYRHVRQFQVAPDAIDRLYKMFGWKMKMFAERVHATSKDLENGFKWFCKHIEPSPLAGHRNAALIKARMLYIMPTQTMITRFRGLPYSQQPDEVVRGTEEDISHTVMLLGNTYTAVTPLLPFKCRLDLLYFYCRLTMLREATRMVDFVDQTDCSQYTKRLVAGLCDHITEEVLENVQELQLLLDQSRSYKLKRLETEASLVKVCFVRLLKDAGVSHGMIGDDACQLLLRVEKLVRTYPDSAGMFRSGYDSVKCYWEGSKTIATDLWTTDTRKFWKQWGDYEVGFLVYCELGHPYSQRSFPSCPECGRKVERKVPESQADYERNLNREEFLRVLNQSVGYH